jgi:hypothetical protein
VDAGRVIAADRPHVRELAERSSSAGLVRLLWHEGTRLVWVEVSPPLGDGALAIRVPPERALDAFRHPYAYAGRSTGHVRPSRSSDRVPRFGERPRETRGR